MDKSSKIYIAGHRGMVGSSILRAFQSKGYTNLVLKTSSELDLRNQQAVASFFAKEKPEYVFLSAAKVGGIVANNTYRADFIYENLIIQNNVIHHAYLNNVKKLLFLGSSCIYPKMAPQPLKEEYLLTGLLELTNEPYAIAKIAGIKMCDAYRDQYGCNFISVMPTNLYGTHDNFDLETSHVFPALINRYVTARRKGASEVTLWGTGAPKREFLHSSDLAAAVLLAVEKYDSELHLNIGTGEDLSIKELSTKISQISGFKGETKWDLSKPDGTPRKVLDVSRLRALGWEPKVSLDDGIRETIQYFESNYN